MRSRVSTDMILLQCSSYCWYSYSSRFAYVLTLKLWWYSRACSPGTISTYYLKWNIRYFTNSHNSRSTVLSSLLLLRVCTLLSLPHFLPNFNFRSTAHSKVPPPALNDPCAHTQRTLIRQIRDQAFANNAHTSRTWFDIASSQFNSFKKSTLITRRTTYCTRN